MSRLAAADAQSFWMSAKIPNDQFLLYAFDGVPADLPAALAEVLGRARRCPDLGLRIRDDRRWGWPEWVGAPVDSSQIRVDAGPRQWAGCLDAVTQLIGDQLDVGSRAWRLHVYPEVADVPGAAGTATVLVLQISHALADGTRTAELAAWLFGRAAPVPALPPVRSGVLPVRAVAAARLHRRFEREVAAGEIAAPPPPRPALSINAAPGPLRRVRTVVCRRSELPSAPTVTVSALLAIGAALAGHLRDRGEDPSELGAEVPMRKAGPRQAHNHFGNVGIGLYPAAPTSERIERILEDLRQAGQRARHPATLAAGRATAAVPAALVRWGVARFDPALRSPTVTGNTVVSSVNRGAADLRFGTAPVLLTAGFPGLSPMMSLTHGVHGIGDTIVVSVHTAEPAFDAAATAAYLDRLAAELRPR